MSLVTAITQLQAIAKLCGSMKYAPDQPSDNISVYPFSIAYPGSGDLNAEASNQARHIHTIIVEFHIAPRTMLNLAIKNMTPYIEEYANRLVEDPTLGGAVSTIVFPIHYEFIATEWAQVTTVGIRFSIPVKNRMQAST